MAQSFDGDIKLSVSLDTKPVQDTINKFGKSVAKAFADGNISVDDMNKATTNFSSTVNETNKSVKDLDKSLGKASQDAKKMDGTKAANDTKLAFERAGETIGKAFSKVTDIFKLSNNSTKGQQSGLASVFANAGKAIDSAYLKMTRFFRLGNDNTMEQSMERTVDEAKKMGSAMEETASKTTSAHSKMTKAELQHENRVIKLRERIEMLERKQAEFASQQIPTDDYKSLEKEIIDTEKAMGRLRGKMADMKDAGKVVPVEMEEKLERLKEDYRELIAAQQKLENSGRAFTSGLDTEAGIRNTQQLEAARREMEILNAEQEKTGKTAKKTSSKITSYFSKAFGKIRNLGSKMWGGIKGIFNKMKDKAKSSANDMDKSFKRGFRNILKYALGIRSFYLLFRKIRSAAKEALKAMATQFPEINAQLSSLKNSFIQLKGSIGTVVQPLVTLLAPALEMIINLATAAANAVANFVAIITGQQYIYKAKKGTTSFADAQDASTAATEKNTKALEENQKQLGHYDKLNIIDQDKSKNGAGGSGGGAGSAGEMTFEKVPVDSQVKEFVKRLKDAWKKADLTDIGRIIGEKLKKALNKINWNKIQTEAQKIGKRLGTLLAGFVSVPGLARSIGNAIGNALNTVLISIRSFVKNVPWYKFGKFLADGLSSALLAKDKNGTTLIGNIAQTFVSIVNAAIDAFTGFVKNLKWKEIGREIAKWIKWAIENIKFEQFMEACGHLVNGIVDLIYELVSDMNTWKRLGEKVAKGINNLFTTINWAKLGKTISDSIMGILTAIESALDTLDWGSIGIAIGEFLGSIDWFGIFTKTLVVIGKAFWGVFKALITPSGNIQGDIIKWVTLAIGGIFVVKKFTGLISTIKGFFSGILSKGLASSATASAAASAGTTIAEGVAGGVASSSSSLISKIGGTISSVLGKVALVGGVAVAGLAIGKAIGELIMSGVKEETEAAEVARKTAHEIGKREVAEVTKTIDKLQEKLKQSRKVLDDFNSALKNADNNNGLKGTIKDFLTLSKRTKLTAVETEVLKKKTKELIKAYPELNKYIDKNTGRLKINEKQLKEITEAHKQEEKAIAAQQNAEKLYEEKKYLTKAVNEAKQAMDNAQATFDAHYKKLQQIGEQSGKDSEAYQKQLRITGEVANALNGARATYANLTEQQKKNNEAIEKANNLMETAKVKTSEWKEASKELKSKLKELNASEKETKEITKALKDAVKNGELSWKDYKDIIGKNYKSVNELKEVLEKTGKVKVSPKVTVDTKGQVEKVKNLAAYLKALKPVYNTKVRADMEYSFKVNGKKVTGPISAAQMQYLWTSGQARANAEGGIFTGSGWHDVQGYASGGTVRSGQFFMARENGIPELVGTIKNHTAVMNNNQIVSSVANGVYRAVAGVASAILPYVRSQTHAMNWLAQNGLQVPEISKVASGKVLPASSQFISIMGSSKSEGQSLDSVVEAIAQLAQRDTQKEPIIIQMPNGKVLAECVWEEESKKYKQVRSSTLRSQFAGGY